MVTHGQCDEWKRSFFPIPSLEGRDTVTCVTFQSESIDRIPSLFTHVPHTPVVGPAIFSALLKLFLHEQCELDQFFQTLMCTQVSWRSRLKKKKKTYSNSVGLRWDLRVCISNKLPWMSMKLVHKSDAEQQSCTEDWGLRATRLTVCRLLQKSSEPQFSIFWW